MTVRANVEIPLRAKGLSAADRTSLVEETVAALGLADSLDLPVAVVAECSKGGDCPCSGLPARGLMMDEPSPPWTPRRG